MGYGLGARGSLRFGKNIASTKVHGNSLLSKRPTWVYELHTKNGITSKTIPEKRYNRKFMSDKIMKNKVLYPNRLEAYKEEYRRNIINRGPLNKNMH